MNRTMNHAQALHSNGIKTLCRLWGSDAPQAEMRPRSVGKAHPLLLTSLLFEESLAAITSQMCIVRHDVSRVSQESNVLQSQMRESLSCVTLRRARPLQETPHVGRKTDVRASLCNGNAPGAPFKSVRTGASQEWRQILQSSGESRTLAPRSTWRATCRGLGFVHSRELPRVSGKGSFEWRQ